MGSGIRTGLVMGSAMVFALGITLTAAEDASAKSNKKKNCANAEAMFQATGQGDEDGDGLSDCRESRQLRTSPRNPDTDGDDLMDGEEVAGRSDPLIADSDHDGFEDGEDDSPRIPEQKVEGFLDALTCPSVGVLGSISVLGTTAVLDDLTEFEDGTCAELAEMLVAATAAGTPMLVEVEIAEDALGVMTAIEVEREDDCGEHDDDDDDSDDDDEDDEDEGDEDSDEDENEED